MASHRGDPNAPLDEQSILLSLSTGSNSTMTSSLRFKQTLVANASALRFEEFVWIWNRFQNQHTPMLHIQMAKWLAERWNARDQKLLLLAFRNSGKSTLVGLFAAWLLFRNPDTRILVLAADFALAKKMVRNVKRLVERHPFTQSLKPTRGDQWAAEQFTVHRNAELRDPSMLAKGIGANITGLRADVIICDDVEVPNTCHTAQKRLELRERLQELEYVKVPNGLQLFIGTPHTYYSIYSEKTYPESGEARPFLMHYSRLSLPLLDGDGNSRWPDRFPTEHIESLILESGPNKFKSQMLLQPVNIADGRLDPDLISIYHERLDYREGNTEARLYLGERRLVSASCWWDPAYGSRDSGDASVIACVFTSADGQYWIHDIRYLFHSASADCDTDAATDMCHQVASFVKQNHLPSIVIETNGLGRFLPGLLRRELRASRIRCSVLEHASKRNKDLRILDAFEAVLAAGRLHVHAGVLATAFMREMREWRPGTGCRDDGLDAVAGCLLAEPVRLSWSSYPHPQDAPPPWTLGGRIHVADDRFVP